MASWDSVTGWSWLEVNTWGEGRLPSQKVTPIQGGGCQIAPGSCLELIFLIRAGERGWERRGELSSPVAPLNQSRSSLSSCRSRGSLNRQVTDHCYFTPFYISLKIILHSAVDHCTHSRCCLSHQWLSVSWMNSPCSLSLRMLGGLADTWGEDSGVQKDCHFWSFIILCTIQQIWSVNTVSGKFSYLPASFKRYIYRYVFFFYSAKTMYDIYVIQNV